MKILTVLGTRPEIIRLSLIIKKLDELAEKHILVHTGQNFASTLSDVFFEELEIRTPDYHMDVKNLSLGNQVGTMFAELEKILDIEKPDKMLVLGDTNSALCAIISERKGIPVYHMEAGNRCFDLNVPEEKNRKVIDAISSYNLPYTKNSRENLLKEGVPVQRIFVSGNPIHEVLEHYKGKINQSKVLETLGLMEKDFFLVTIHRAENVDHDASLNEIIEGLNLVAEKYKKPIICSTHPRTRSKLDRAKANVHSLIEFHEPFGLFDFITLQKHAFCVLTDSGTVQEESCLFHIPAVTVRTTTERPETLKCGSNMISGIDAKSILRAVDVMVSGTCNWEFPEGYEDLNVSDKVIKFLMGGKGIV